MRIHNRFLIALTGLFLLMIIPAMACTLTEDDEVPTPIPTIAPMDSNILLTLSPAAGDNGFVPATATATDAANDGGSLVTDNCIVSTAGYAYTVQSGDTLSDLAVRTSSTIESIQKQNCLENPDDLVVGQKLYLPTIPIPQATPTFICQNVWFFNFRSGYSPVDDLKNLYPVCPNPVSVVSADGLNFEGGRVYRYAPDAARGETIGTIYVIYNDRTWETYPDAWDGGAYTEVDLAPPADRFRPPVNSIGWLWHTVPDVRSKLGFAYASSSSPFTGRLQTVANADGHFANNTFYFYIDHGFNNVVLRMYSVNMGPNRWEVVGSY